MQIASDVNFASDEAGELAMNAGLTASDFEGVTSSGVSGYTVKDVRALLTKTDTDPGSTEPYRVETWNGYPMYVCDNPRISTLDEDVMRRRLGLPPLA